MTADQIAGLAPALTQFLGCFKPCFVTKNTFGHLGTYCRGLLSDLPRKSVEPIALSAGCAVRTLQEFLTHHAWDQGRMRDQVQRRVVRDHLPAPGGKPAGGVGVVGWVDETSVPKKGDKTPGVQRQYCGASGKLDNCIVTVHLACRCGQFMAMLDSDLFLPEQTWDADRDRRRAAHIPDHVLYASKWLLALDQVKRALANGVRFDWLTFDEWYGGKPEFLRGLEDLGLLYVCEVPANLPCYPGFPRYRSLQRPFAAQRVDGAGKWSKPFKGKPWRKVRLARKTLGDQVWEVRAAQVYLSRDGGRPTDRTYWLLVARSVKTGAVKYFVSNAPPGTALLTLLKVAFTRWGVEHVFRLAKAEVGFSHFEGRSYTGLMRHMTLCQLVLLFAAEQTDRLRGEKSRGDGGADGAGAQHAVPRVARPPLQAAAGQARRVGHPIPPSPQSGRQAFPPTHLTETRVAL
jgi:SRSO17 transposase